MSEPILACSRASLNPKALHVSSFALLALNVLARDNLADAPLGYIRLESMPAVFLSRLDLLKKSNPARTPKTPPVFKMQASLLHQHKRSQLCTSSVLTHDKPTASKTITNRRPYVMQCSL